MDYSKLKIPHYFFNLLDSTVLDHSLSKENFFWQNGNRSNLDVRFSPKKIYDQAPYFYISKKRVKFEVNRLSNFRVMAVTDLKNIVSRKTHLKF